MFQIHLKIEDIKDVIKEIMQFYFSDEMKFL